MATTTPNYGWSVPESTDLVKDGATAIELLGDSIDASFVDLLGGTTGQVLTKASGTDLDFSFTTPATTAGMTLISTTTLSGASTTITIPNGFVNIQLFTFGITNNTANAFGKIDPNALNNITDLTVVGGVAGSGKSYTTSINSTIFINFNENALRTDSDNSYTLTINDYLNTSNFKSFTLVSDYLSGASVRIGEAQFGTIRTATAISSLVFTQPGGTWSAGTVQLYGVK